MTAQSVGVGRLTSGIADRWWAPRIYRARPPVVFMAGGGTTALAGAGEAGHIVDALVDAGFRVVQPSVPWLLGNPAAVDRIDDAVTFAVDELGGIDGPPIIVGQSNGGLCGLAYAASHPVTAFVGLICPVDLDAIYQGDLLGHRSDIETAWAVTHPQPLPPGASPLDHVATIDAPMQLWEASDDPLAVGVAAYATAVGADLRSVGPLGHTAQAVSAADADRVVEFIRAAIPA